MIQLIIFYHFYHIWSSNPLSGESIYSRNQLYYLHQTCTYNTSYNTIYIKQVHTIRIYRYISNNPTYWEIHYNLVINFNNLNKLVHTIRLYILSSKPHPRWESWLDINFTPDKSIQSDSIYSFQQPSHLQNPQFKRVHTI